MSVADQTKTVPLDWLNERGNGVTAQFVDYVKPLVRGMDAPFPVDLPRYPRLRGAHVARKLEPYARQK